MNKQITEDYCSFEIAQLLKEKGFDVPCRQAYFNGSLVDYTLYGFCDGELLDCPSQSLALKWLREVHDLHIVVYPWQADNEEKAIHWCCTVYKSFAHLGNDVYTNETPKSYEQAVEAALKYILENLI
jgi:hypothetical protein